MAKLFGFEFDWNRKSTKPATQSIKPTGTALSPIPPENADGALNVQYGAGGGYYGYYLDLDGTIVDDFQLINRYREMQVIAEVDEAIDQIVNEFIIQDSGRMPVSLDLDNVTEELLDEELKIRIQAEFDGLLKMMNFHKDAYSIIRQWYIDGRLYYHLVVDEEADENGIQEMRIIDPRTIRKIREVKRVRHEETQMDIIEVVREYFVFNPMGFVAPSINAGQTGTSASMLQYNGVKMTIDSVAFVASGLYDQAKKTVLSWLHKAIKPLNLMRMMEDSCVIYRVSRAPERRVFYIDVGNLPKQKAEQYLSDIMQRYRNKLVYDVATGEIRDDRKFMSIMEDFWLPRREGGKGTEIVTLPAGQNLSEMEDVDYFRRKLYRALNLPPSRIDQGTGFALGRASEISRDELRFNKFIHRLQAQFGTLFDQLLERQLRLKNVLTEQEWFRIKDSIQYQWQTDVYFEELKAQEMWRERMNLLSQADPYINKYFSTKWVQREILKMTDDDVAAMHDDFDDAENPFGGEEGEDDTGSNPFGLDQDGEDEGEDGKKALFGQSLDDEADEVLAGTDDDEADDDEADDDKDEGDDKSDDDDDESDEDDEDEPKKKTIKVKKIFDGKSKSKPKPKPKSKKKSKGGKKKPPFGRKG